MNDQQRTELEAGRYPSGLTRPETRSIMAVREFLAASGLDASLASGCRDYASRLLAADYEAVGGTCTAVCVGRVEPCNWQDGARKMTEGRRGCGQPVFLRYDSAERVLEHITAKETP